MTRFLKKHHPLIFAVAVTLNACGGGGGSPSLSADSPVAAKMAALAVTQSVPDNYKSITLSRNSLISDSEIAQSPNGPDRVWIQVWYLDQSGQRQPLAVVTLRQLNQLGGTLTFHNVPRGVSTLYSEAYTVGPAGDELTLANHEVPA